MSLREDEQVRVAVLRAAARPAPYVVALLAAWAVSGPGGLLAAMLAGTTGYLGMVVGILIVAPDVRVEALPEGETPLLPEGEERRESAARRPLPAELRCRFQVVHRNVEAMLQNWPADLLIPLEKEHLSKAPEAFREMGHLWARMDEEDPGRERLAARLDRLEEQVGSLKATWSELIAREGDRGEILEELEKTGDELEALLEVT